MEDDDYSSWILDQVSGDGCYKKRRNVICEWIEVKKIMLSFNKTYIQVFNSMLERKSPSVWKKILSACKV